MRTYIAIVFFITLSISRVLMAQGAYYKVTGISGKVILNKTGKNLIEDQKFFSTDLLTFSSFNDWVMVNDDKHGVFMLEPDISLHKYKITAISVAMLTYNYTPPPGLRPERAPDSSNKDKYTTVYRSSLHQSGTKTNLANDTYGSIEYEVTNIYGAVKLVRTNQTLIPRQKIRNTDTLFFSATNDWLVVTNSKKESFLIEADKDLYHFRISALDVSLGPVQYTTVVNAPALTTAKSPINFDYQIIKIKGDIRLQRTMQKLLSGQKISRSDKLVFSSGDDWLVVINNKMETFMVAYDKIIHDYELMPLDISIAAKGVVELDGIAEVSNYFTDRPAILLLNGRHSIYFNKKTFPVLQNGYFYIEYQYRGQHLSKVLPPKNNIVTLEENELFPLTYSNAEERIDANLYYYNKTNRQSQRIARFKISTIDEVGSGNEATVLMRAFVLNMEEPVNVRLKIRDYINKIYGYSDPAQFDSWLQDLQFMTDPK